MAIHTNLHRIGFQSTPSVWRETSNLKTGKRYSAISIHSLRVEGDLALLSRRARTCHFNPLPPCGGRPGVICPEKVAIGISIHSLRVEGDPDSRTDRVLIAISIHSLRVEGDSPRRQLAGCNFLFQSTPSVWRETRWQGQLVIVDGISIHSLRVEGDPDSRTDRVLIAISIHSLRVEGDSPRRQLAGCNFLFQSTPSVWRETRWQGQLVIVDGISIHSLRVEGDPVRSNSAAHGHYFNPLPPCGGRRLPFSHSVTKRRFQSTPSVWRETVIHIPCYTYTDISIHSLRVEGDRPSRSAIWRILFQSTPSVWRETFVHITKALASRFQSTPSVWRETVW